MQVRWLLGKLTEAQDKGIDDLVCEMHKVDEDKDDLSDILNQEEHPGEYCTRRGSEAL